MLAAMRFGSVRGLGVLRRGVLVGYMWFPQAGASAVVGERQMASGERLEQ